MNVDETGHKENGDKFWTWCFRAELYVLFKIDKSRGSKVSIEVLGKEFNGLLGCDYFSAYRKYMKDFNVMVQFCIAHLIRDSGKNTEEEMRRMSRIDFENSVPHISSLSQHLKSILQIILQNKLFVSLS